MGIVSGSTLLIFVGMAAAGPTNWGVRTAPGQAAWPADKPLGTAPSAKSAFDLNSAAGLASKWGTVTSTKRTPARNRAVGGARNSFHLSGRAIDVARRPGVRHSMIEASYRSAGYRLIESLDEGDHSHFAFGAPPAPAKKAEAPKAEATETPKKPTRWRIAYAPSAR